jgi:hypothetical protein
LTPATPEFRSHPTLGQFRPGKTREGKTMSKQQPSHNAYVVTDPKEGSEKKAFWHRVGTVWPHKNGNGFDLVIPEGLSVSGRIVCTEPKEKEPT